MPPGKILKDARALLASKQAARVAGPAGDNNVQPANNDLIDVSRSSDESSLAFDEDSILQLACQQAVQFHKDKLWLTSVMLEIQTDLKKNWNVAKVESDLAKVMKMVNEMCTKQEDVLRFIHSSVSSPPPKVSSQKPELLPKEHFLNVRTSQVKRVRVDDWIRWSDLSLDIKPEPETVYVLRSERTPKDINDGYHWQEIEKKEGRRSFSNANSWTGFCDPKANCQKMVKR